MSIPCSRPPPLPPPLCKIFLFHHLGSSSPFSPPTPAPFFVFLLNPKLPSPSFRGLAYFCLLLCFQGVVSFIHIKQRSLVTLSYLFLRAAIGANREDVVRAEVRVTFLYVSRYHDFTHGRLVPCQYKSISAHHGRLSTWA